MENKIFKLHLYWYVQEFENIEGDFKICFHLFPELPFEESRKQIDIY